MKFILVDPDTDLRMRMMGLLKQAFGWITLVTNVEKHEDAKPVVFENQDADIVFVADGSPTGDGRTTAVELRVTFPHLKVVITSHTLTEKEAEELGLGLFFNKLSSADECKRFVEKLLHSSA